MDAVLGVPLADGEQLFYAYEVDMQKKRLVGGLIGAGLMLLGFVSMWFLCVTIIAIPFGAFILYKGLSPDKSAIVGMFLSDQRFVGIPFDGQLPAREIPLVDIEDVDCKRKGKRVTHRSGLAAMAVNAAVSAIQEHQANQQAKTHPNYWTNAVELHILLNGGRMEKMNIEQQEGPNVGPILATGLVKGWESLVAIESAPAARTVSKL